MSDKLAQIKASILALTLADVADLTRDQIELLRGVAQITPDVPLRAGLTPEEIYTYENARPGQSGKIQAIKMVRDRTKLGLADAKNLVESAAQRLGLVQSSERNPHHWEQ